MRHTRAHPEPAKASQKITSRIPRGYQQDTRAHPEDNTETYQSQPEDTSRIPEPAKASQRIPKQGMRHTRAYQRTR